MSLLRHTQAIQRSQEAQKKTLKKLVGTKMRHKIRKPQKRSYASSC